MIFLTAFTWLMATDLMIFMAQDKYFALTVQKLDLKMTSEREAGFQKSSFLKHSFTFTLAAKL